MLIAHAVSDLVTNILVVTTIKQADTIIVLKKGEIVEKGTNNELINADGLYRQLCEVQFGG